MVYEGSISAGVRRIEAITGAAALDRFQETSDALARVAAALRTSESELIEQVERLVHQQKALERQIEQIKSELARRQIESLAPQEAAGFKVVCRYLPDMDRQQLRSAADWLRSKGADVVVLGTDSGAIISAVRKEVASKVHAGKLLGLVAAKTGGKGGGRPDMAEGGAKDVGALKAAVESVPELLKDLT